GGGGGRAGGLGGGGGAGARLRRAGPARAPGADPAGARPRAAATARAISTRRRPRAASGAEPSHRGARVARRPTVEPTDPTAPRVGRAGRVRGLVVVVRPVAGLGCPCVGAVGAGPGPGAVARRLRGPLRRPVRVRAVAPAPRRRREARAPRGALALEGAAELPVRGPRGMDERRGLDEGELAPRRPAAGVAALDGRDLEPADRPPHRALDALHADAGV